MRRLPVFKYIPKDSTKIERPELKAEVYLYTGTRPGWPFSVIGYLGKSSKASFNNCFKTEWQRQEHVNKFFHNIEEVQKQRADYKAQEKLKKDTRNALGFYERAKLDHYLSTAEVARYIKELLAKTYPTVKFSVRSDKYSMGSSIDVSWTDGPTAKNVNAKIGFLGSAGFDGMIDMKYHYDHYISPDNTISLKGTSGTGGSMGTVSALKCVKPHPEAITVHLSADSIHTRREISDKLIGEVITKLAKKYNGTEPPTVEQFNKGGGWDSSPIGNWSNELHWSWRSIISRELEESTV